MAMRKSPLNRRGGYDRAFCVHEGRPTAENGQSLGTVIGSNSSENGYGEEINSAVAKSCHVILLGFSALECLTLLQPW